MQRNETENFKTYQQRRAAANLAVRHINIKTKGGGTVSNRQRLRSATDHTGFRTGIKGMASSNNTAQGASLKSHFDSMRGRNSRRRAA